MSNYTETFKVTSFVDFEIASHFGDISFPVHLSSSTKAAILCENFPVWLRVFYSPNCQPEVFLGFS